MSPRAVLVRGPAVAGVGAGLVLLVLPEPVLRRLAPEFPRERRWVVRLLGARLLAQHAAVLAAPRPPILRMAAGLEMLHAATMVPLLRSRRYGRAARISGAAAAVSGAWASVA